MSILGNYVSRKKPPAPLLRVEFALEEGALEDDKMGLVSVRRVDGLINIHRFASWRGTEPWRPEMCYPGDPHEEWFSTMWDECGEYMLDGVPEDFDKYATLVLEGRMWSRHYSGPDGEDYDSGFDVERVVESVLRAPTPKA